MASADDNVSQRLVMSDQKPGYNKRKNEEQNNSKKLKLNDLSVHQISSEGDLDGSLSANKEHEHDKPESISEQELARNSHDKYKLIKSKEESSEPSSQGQDHHVSQRVVIHDKYKLKSTEEQISISEQQERELEDKLKQQKLKVKYLEQYALFLGLIQNPTTREIMDKAIKSFRECSSYALKEAVFNCFNIIFCESNNLIKELKSSGKKQQQGICRKYLNEKKQAKTKTNKMKVDGKLIKILEELGLFPNYIEGLYELKEHRNKCVHELQFEIDKDDASESIILTFNILKKLPLNVPDQFFSKLIKTMIGESKESTVIFDFQAEDNSLIVSVDDIVSERVVIPEKYKSKSIEEQISICKQQERELEDKLKQQKLKVKYLEQYDHILGLIQNQETRQIMDQAFKSFEKGSSNAFKKAILSFWNIIIREFNNLIVELASSGDERQQEICTEHLNKKKKAINKDEKMKVDEELMIILGKLGLFPNYIEDLKQLEEHHKKCRDEPKFLIQSHTVIECIAKVFAILLKSPLNDQTDIYLKMMAPTDDTGRIFESIKKRINTYKSTGLSSSHQEKLKKYGITFNPNKLNELNVLFSENRKIFHLRTSATQLSAIKVIEALAQSTNYKAQDSYFFVCLSELLCPGTKEWIISAFESSFYHGLLAIDCDSKTEDILTLYEELSRIIKDNSQKKSF